MQRCVFRSIVGAVVLLIHGFAMGQGPRVQEIPLPPEATDISYSKDRGDIRMKFPEDMKAAGEFYRTELTRQKWTRSKKDNLQKNFWVQTFSNGDRTLEVRADNRGTGCEIRLTPTGYLWDEDLAPRPETIPIPEDASDVEYDDFFERIEFKHEDTPEELIEFYASKLIPPTWNKSTEDRADEGSGYLVRESGKASVSIRIEVEDEESVVTISTEGMSWDEIEKKQAEKEEKEESEKGDDPAMAEAPKRAEKPKRGIEKLEKLASSASVTVDGKTTQLTEVIAYELISYGEWRTHIVATARPLKQDSLLKLLKSNVPEEKWEDQFRLPMPNVRLVLDADDSLRSIQLQADGIPGSSTEITGEAIVEGGRARGKAVLAGDKFFDHTYSAEITFDTKLINPSEAAPKLLADAPKLDHRGSIKLDGKLNRLPHVIAYEESSSDRKVIHVVLTAKPVDPAKVRASLNKSGELETSVIGFQPQVDLVVDQSDELSSMSIWCDGNSINWSGNDKVTSLIQSEGDRIRGTAQTVSAEDVFGKPCEFEVSFDTVIIRADSKKAD
ncbi:MAG: hypothetical protein JNL58_15675 [Planctomyces sp.]|nr:hypothetical protein [Planctomyces sp.]